MAFSFEIKCSGFKELESALLTKAQLEGVKTVVAKNGADLNNLAQRKAEFRGHYEWKKGEGLVFKAPTGKLRGSIGLSLKNNGLTAEVKPTAEYAAYVELGTRFMEAQPYLKPAFDIQKKKFLSDLKKLTR